MKLNYYEVRMQRQQEKQSRVSPGSFHKIFFWNYIADYSIGKCRLET